MSSPRRSAGLRGTSPSRTASVSTRRRTERCARIPQGEPELGREGSVSHRPSRTPRSGAGQACSTSTRASGKGLWR
jgi:hypothetical protein